MAQTNAYDFEMTNINGKQVSLNDYKGKVSLVVNVASECGLTPQYEALESLYEQYAEKGLVVLGFPANEFGAQEPGTNEEIKEFCSTKFGIKFPMFAKIAVKGPAIHPFYSFLTAQQPEAIIKPGTSFEADLAKHGLTREIKTDILWNFEKFLIDRNGKVLARFNPDIKPDDQLIIAAIEKALN